MTDKRFAKALGSNIKAELRRKDKTQADAAHALGLKSQSAISDRLNGDVRFGFDEVLALAAWLDVPLSRLMEGLPAIQPSDGEVANLLSPLVLAA